MQDVMNDKRPYFSEDVTGDKFGGGIHQQVVAVSFGTMVGNFVGLDPHAKGKARNKESDEVKCQTGQAWPVVRHGLGRTTFA